MLYTDHSVLHDIFTDANLPLWRDPSYVDEDDNVKILPSCSARALHKKPDEQAEEEQATSWGG